MKYKLTMSNARTISTDLNNEKAVNRAENRFKAKVIKADKGKA